MPPHRAGSNSSFSDMTATSEEASDSEEQVHFATRPRRQAQQQARDAIRRSIRRTKEAESDARETTSDEGGSSRRGRKGRAGRRIEVRRSGRATNRVDYAAVVDVDSENDASSDESADSRTRRAVARPPRSRSKSNTDAVTVTTSEDSESEPASEGSPRPTVVHPTTPLKTSPLRPDKRRGAGAETDRSPRGSHGDAVGPDAGSGAAEAAYSAADVERILDFNEDRDEMLVKFSEASYREAAWVSREDLDVERRLLVRHFLKRLKDDEEFYAGLGLEEDWLEAERVLREEKKVDKRTRESVTWFLVKWRGRPYEESTWESEENFPNPDFPGDAVCLEQYRALGSRFQSTLATKAETMDALSRLMKVKVQEKSGGEQQASGGGGGGGGGGGHCTVTGGVGVLPTFRNGRALRSYQVVGLQWMVRNFVHGRSCVLGDEMGLGKTAQTISVLQFMRERLGIEGPFLIVAPLSTLGHWQREIETWTDMHVVPYFGSQKDREIIRAYELACPRNAPPRFNVVLTSPDCVSRETGVLSPFKFAVAVVDEAHKLKSRASKFFKQFVELTGILGKKKAPWRLLLTGTPVQNNIGELYSVLSVLDPAKHPPTDDGLEDFMEEYGGNTPTAEQVEALQSLLRPILLRRMKEDVEDLPEKEEVIVWTELTAEQRAVYRATFERRIGDLMKGVGAKNLPSLNNVSMLLREVCNHPFLVHGLEDELRARQGLPPRSAAVGSQEDPKRELEFLVGASGKMVLLSKLLPKLKGEGRRVLIFSQFRIMLNLLEDFLRLSGYSFERIDGAIRGQERQDAIDRFMDPESDSFVFLLSTRAGGQGITLTAADTVIIYDSDWNPQAMARCHRIGQERDVTVYRLLSRNTYEEAIFQTASRKYGLDEAILGSMDKGQKEGRLNAGEIADLIKYGAHLLKEEDTGAAQEAEKEFCGQDIDMILQGRTEKRSLGTRKGNMFSVAKFEAGVKAVQDGDDEAFWRSLLPTAAEAYEKSLWQQWEKPKEKRRAAQNKTYADLAEEEDASSEEMIVEEEPAEQPQKRGPGRPKGRKQEPRPAPPPAPESWVLSEHMGSAADEADTAVSSQAAPPAKHMWSPTEIVSVARALLMSLGDHSKADLQRVSPGLIMRDENDVLDLAEKVIAVWKEAATVESSWKERKKAAVDKAVSEINARYDTAVTEARAAMHARRTHILAQRRIYEAKVKEKQAELTACLGMVPRDQGKALSLEAELNDLVRRCNDLGTEYEAIQKEYAEKTGELTTSRTRDVAEARKQVAQTETRERYVPSNELKRSVPKHMRRGLLYHVTLDALAKDSEKALSLLQEREAIRRTMLRSTDEGAEWREHMSVTKTTGPFPADWWKPACGQCDRALLRSVMRWGSPSILHRAEKWQQWDRILTDESEDGLPLLTCIVSCQGVPPEFHDRYKEAVEKQPAPAENGAPQEVSIVLGHGPAAKSVKTRGIITLHFWDDFRRKVDKRFAALSSFLAKQVQTSSREITFDGRNARKAALPAAPPLYGVLRGPASSGPSEGVGQAPVSDKRPVVKAEEAAGADAGGKYPAASVIAAGHSDAAAPSLTPIAAVKATTGTLSTPAYGLSSDAPGRVGEDGRTVPYEKRGREEGEGSEGGQGAEKRRKVAESLQESSDVEIVA